MLNEGAGETTKRRKMSRDKGMWDRKREWVDF